MEDTKPISEYNITEKDFIVLTVKPTRTNNTKTTTQPQRIQTPPQTTQQTQSSPPQTQTQSTQQQTQSQPSQNQPSTQPQTQTEGQDPPEELINIVAAMGFPRDEVIRALKLTGNIPARAIDLLTGGGSLDDEEFIDEGQSGNFTPGIGMGGQQGTGQQGGGGGNVFASLRNHPLFVQMRALVQANPQYLEELLGNIANQSPQLFQIIQQNQDQFIQS